MSCPSRILAPVDFSAASEDALRYAIAWAGQCGSELHVLHVVPDASRQPWAIDAIGVAAASITDEWILEARQSLDELLARLPAPAGRLHTAVLVGRPALEILDYATAEQIDFIVMAPGQHDVLLQWMVGSVAEQVVRRAPCPVLTLPSAVKAPRWLGATRTILVPTDLSDASRDAFAYACDLATALGAAVRVLHVVAPPWERQLTYLPPQHVIEQLRQQTGARPDRGPAPVDRGCEVQSAIRIGDPFDAIKAYAEEVHADLIVMATHGRGAMQRLLLGNIAQRLLRRAPCPVVTLTAHVPAASLTASSAEPAVPVLAATGF